MAAEAERNSGFSLNMKKMGAKLISRYRGALLGLAAGDALGTTIEFTTPGSFQPLSDIIGGGPFRLNPGEWTDDLHGALPVWRGGYT